MSDSAPIGVVLPTTFHRTMFFNRFSVEHEEAFVLIHFGWVGKSGALVDAYSVVISELELEGLRAGTLEYLGRQGTLLDAPPTWQSPGTLKSELANHIVMAHHLNISETLIYSFSYWAALEKAKQNLQDKKPDRGEVNIIAEGMAMLRSSLRVQQHLIRLLFPSKEPTLPNV